MSLIKQLAGETILYGLGQILPRVFHFIIFSSYLTYRLNDSPGDYAVYLDLYAYASVLIVIFSYRMDTAFFRFGSKEKSKEHIYQTALLPMIGTSLLLIVMGFLFSDSIATLLTYPGRGYYIIWFSFIIALDVLVLLPMARLRLESRPRLFVLFKVVNVLISILLVLLFLEIIPRIDSEWIASTFPFIRSDIDFVFLSNLVASAIMFVGLMYIYPVRSKNIDWTIWKKMVRYSWPLIIVGVAGSINQFFGVPLQKFFLGDSFEINKNEAAIYGAVQKIPALLAMFTTAYNYAAEPFFFRNASRSDSKELYGDVALFFIIIAGVGVLGIFLFVDVLQYVLGSNFREGMYLVPILLLSYLLLGIYYNVSIWYKLSDNTEYGAVIASVGAVITITGSIIFLPIIGVSASAFAAFACYFIMVLLAYFIGRVKYPIHYPVTSMLRILGLIVGFMVVGYYLRTDGIVLNVLVGIALLIVYGIACLSLEKQKFRMYFYSN